MKNVNVLLKNTLGYFAKIRFLVWLVVMLAFHAEIFSQWQPTSGPEGKLMRCFAALGNDVFVGSCGGVFITSDNGNLWTPVNNGLTSRDMKYFVTIGDIIYAAADEGVFKSVNHGQTWTAMENGLRKVYVKSMAVCGNHIFAGSYTKGMFVSDNFGNSWTVQQRTDQLVHLHHVF